MTIRRGNRFSGGNRNKRRIGNRGLGKEKVTMLVTSLVVLSALTVTGIYIGQKNESKQDNRIIDFSALDESGDSDRMSDAGNTEQTKELTDGFIEHNDMDVDPELYREYKEANSGEVINPDLAKANEENDSKNPALDEETLSGENEQEPSQDGEPVQKEKEAVAESMSSMTQEEIIAEKTQALIFDETASLAWPLVGNVVINYSMDSYVYFPTLGQYKYSPAIVISAVEGENIASASDGVVSNVFYDEEIGNAVGKGRGYDQPWRTDRNGSRTDKILHAGRM